MRCNDNTVRVYKYDKGLLQEASMDELIKCVVQIKTAKKDKIEELFRPKDYLISPLNTPEKFLEGKYYLNIHIHVTTVDNTRCISVDNSYMLQFRL